METTSQQPDTVLSGGMLVVLGAIGFSAKPVLIKLAYANGASIDAITLMTLRTLLALPIFLAVALWDREASRCRHSATDWATLSVLGVTGYYLASLLDFTGLEYISAGLERLILFLYPTFVVAFSALAYRRGITRRMGLALLLSYLGIGLVYTSGPLAGSTDIAFGSLLVLASGLIYALYLTGIGHLIPRFGTRRFTAYSMTVAASATLLHFALTHPMHDLMVPPRTLALGLALAVFSTVLPAFLINAGIRRIGADRAAVVTSVGPVFTLLLAFVVLGESLGPLQSIGAALVLVGVMQLGLDRART